MKKWLGLWAVVCLFAGLLAPGAGAAERRRITVVFKSDRLPANAEAIIVGAGGQVLAAIPELGVMEVLGPAAMLSTLGSHSDIYTASPSVELQVQPIRAVEAAAEPAHANVTAADLFKAFQWDIKQVTNNGASFGIHEGSHRTVVGIVDTGINSQHQDLSANLLGGRNFTPDGPGGMVIPTDIEDRHGHGSHVAGNVAGNGRILGVGPHLGIRAYRVFGASGGAPSSRIAAAVVAAANDGVDVISMSLGGWDVVAWGYWTDPATGQVYKFRDHADFVASQRAVRYAVARGVVVVASAGNDGADVSNPARNAAILNDMFGAAGFRFQGAVRKTPASLPGVVTVSATGPDKRLASYSSWGTGLVDVSAPGGDFQRWPVGDWYTDMNLSAYRKVGANSNRYAWMAGTSMAAPKVSAVAALIIDQAKARGISLNPAQVVAKLQQSATDMGKRGYDGYYGQGMVDAYSALSQ